mmetsp:Transcript_78818/g.231295  ORF Transcript_78818/g.231295 Transcript_78818/m.231295 type:complete len:212 (+) Transcript_78818:424-1059(+)
MPSAGSSVGSFTSPCAFAASRVSQVLNAPTRTVRLPLSVTPRCSSEVAPSLCEGSVRSLLPHQTWASMTPKWPRSETHRMREPTKRLPLAVHVMSCSSSLLTCRSCRAWTSADQQRRFAMRKASAKATQRGGACLRAPGFPRRGMKSFAWSPTPGKVCQSAFMILSCSSTSKPHLSQCSMSSAVTSYSACARSCGFWLKAMAKGPSGSSRR